MTANKNNTEYEQESKEFSSDELAAMGIAPAVEKPMRLYLSNNKQGGSVCYWAKTPSGNDTKVFLPANAELRTSVQMTVERIELTRSYSDLYAEDPKLHVQGYLPNGKKVDISAGATSYGISALAATLKYNDLVKNGELLTIEFEPSDTTSEGKTGSVFVSVVDEGGGRYENPLKKIEDELLEGVTKESEIKKMKDKIRLSMWSQYAQNIQAIPGAIEILEVFPELDNKIGALCSDNNLLSLPASVESTTSTITDDQVPF